MNQLMSDPAYLMKIITDGSEKAIHVAEQTWTEVRNKVGLGGPDIIHNLRIQNKIQCNNKVM